MMGDGERAKCEGGRRCEGGIGGGGKRAGWRSSFIKSLWEVAPVVFQPVHQWRRRMGRDSQRRTGARPSFLHLSPLPSLPPPPSLHLCPASPLTAHLLTAITPPSSSPPSHCLPLYLPPLLHLPSLSLTVLPPHSVLPSLSSFLHFSREAALDSQMSLACQKLLLTFQFSIFFPLSLLSADAL